MNEAITNVKEWTELLENVIWGDPYDPRPSDFEKTFCQGNELIDVFFSSSRIEVHFMCGDGQIVFNVFSMDAFEEWLNKE